jgi:GNAT superfamily N-acetyltransferase
VTILWHRDEPVGVCVFGCPAASLSVRTKYFGLTNPRGRVALAALNAQLLTLQRVVLHPTYRGAGIGAAFIRRACELCPVPWVETLTAMGRANPVFERAGFVRVGPVTANRDGANRSSTAARAAKREFEYAVPEYYVFDNRQKS